MIFSKRLAFVFIPAVLHLAGCAAKVESKAPPPAPTVEVTNAVPSDADVYVEYPAEELYAILALESNRYQAGIVGENLGTVPPGVNRALSQHNIRGMYVAQYEIMGDPERPKLRPVSSKNVASLNTHDMPPFQAFLEGRPVQRLRHIIQFALLDKIRYRRSQ